MTIYVEKIANIAPPPGMDVHIAKVGHVVLQIAGEFRDPDNHALAIYWGGDQVGSDGRLRPANEWYGVRTLEEAIANPVPGQDTHLPR